MKQIESNQSLKKFTMALAYLLLVTGCGPIGAKEGFSIHDKLVQNDCYEIQDNYARIVPTDLCLEICGKACEY